MKYLLVFPLVFFAALASSASSVAPNGVQCPEVDTLIASQLIAAGKRDKLALEQISKPKSVEDAACLPAFQTIAMAINSSMASVQSVVIAAIVEKALEAACKAVDGAISSAVNELSAGFDFPYGLGGVSVGLNTNRQKLIQDCIAGGGDPEACRKAYIRNETSSIDMNEIIDRETESLINQTFGRFVNSQKRRFLQSARPYTGVNRDVARRLDRKLNTERNKVISGAENVF